MPLTAPDIGWPFSTQTGHSERGSTLKRKVLLGIEQFQFSVPTFGFELNLPTQPVLNPLLKSIIA